MEIRKKIADLLIFILLVGPFFCLYVQNDRSWREVRGVERVGGGGDDTPTDMSNGVRGSPWDVQASNTESMSGAARYGQILNGTDHVIVYNSVPKCGSRTFLETVKRLFRKYNLKVNRVLLRSIKDGHAVHITRDDMMKLVREADTPAYCQGHSPYQYFPNLDPQPVYINFVRDPLARMVSVFYFKRNGDSQINMAARLPQEIRDTTLEQCILENYDECAWYRGLVSSIFCGSNPRCRSDPVWALEQAKTNVVQHYTFIGITEDYEGSLQVLERLMPDMFPDLLKIYNSPITADIIAVSKTREKKPMTQHLNDTARAYLDVDFEFYNFLYDRHRELKRRFGIN